MTDYLLTIQPARVPEEANLLWLCFRVPEGPGLIGESAVASKKSSCSWTMESLAVSLPCNKSSKCFFFVFVYLSVFPACEL